MWRWKKWRTNIAHKQFCENLTAVGLLHSNGNPGKEGFYRSALSLATDVDRKSNNYH